MGQFDYLVPGSGVQAPAADANQFADLIPAAPDATATPAPAGPSPVQDLTSFFTPQAVPVKAAPNGDIPGIDTPLQAPEAPAQRLTDKLPGPLPSFFDIVGSEVQGAMRAANAVPLTPKAGGNVLDVMNAVGNGSLASTKDAWTGAVGQISDKIMQAGQDPSIGGKAADYGDALAKALGASFGILLAPIQGYASVPGAGYIVDGVNKVFAGISGGASAGAVTALDQLPISDDIKQKLTPLVSDTAALAAQLVAGKLVGDTGKEVLMKVSDNSKSILAQFANDPAVKAHLQDQMARASEQPTKVPVTSETPTEQPVPISTPTTKHTAYAKSQGYEPFTPTEQLPTIDMDAKPKPTGPIIQTEPKAGPDLPGYKVEPIQEPSIAQNTPKSTPGAPIGQKVAEPMPRSKLAPMTEQGVKDYVKANYNSLLPKYQEAARAQYQGAKNVISADVAKQILPGYDGEHAGTYHEGSSDFAKHMYKDALDANVGKKNNTVLFTGGGTGAGKSMALRNIGTNLNDYPIVYDTNLTGESALTKIQTALDKGYKVDIKITHRDPYESFVNGVIPRVMKENRIVTAAEHIARHEAVPSDIAAIQERFGGHIENGKLIIEHIDNTGPRESAKVVPMYNLPKIEYNNLYERITKATAEALRAGKITEAHAAAITGSKELGDAGSRPQSRTQGGTGGGGAKSETIGRAPGTSKAAHDINVKLVQQGLDALPPDQLAKYTEGSYKDSAAKVADMLMKDPVSVKQMAKDGQNIPDSIHPQVLFNAVEALAEHTNDTRLQMDLAKSPLATARSEAAASLGSSGYGKTGESTVDRIREIQQAKEDFAGGKPKVSAKAKVLQKSLTDSVNGDNLPIEDKYWAKFLDSITC